MYGVNRLLTVMPALFTLEHKSPSSRLGPAGAGWASRDSSSASRLAPDKRAASPRAASQLARTEGAPPRLGPWPHHPTPPPPPMQHRALGHLRCQAHLERALCAKPSYQQHRDARDNVAPTRRRPASPRPAPAHVATPSRAGSVKCGCNGLLRRMANPVLNGGQVKVVSQRQFEPRAKAVSQLHQACHRGRSACCTDLPGCCL